MQEIGLEVTLEPEAIHPLIPFMLAPMYVRPLTQPGFLTNIFR